MEMKDVGIVLLVLCVGLTSGYLLSPEYVSLEQVQKDSYETQLEAKDAQLEQSILDWEAYSKDLKQFQIDTCVIEKRDTADRLAGRNRELIEANKGWQNLFIDLNKTVSDFNRVLYDFNGGDKK